jgi:hypothetical protein
VVEANNAAPRLQAQLQEGLLLTVSDAVKIAECAAELAKVPCRRARAPWLRFAPHEACVHRLASARKNARHAMLRARSFRAQTFARQIATFCCDQRIMKKTIDTLRGTASLDP